MLTGSGKYLENLVRVTLGVKVRSIELNVSQRCCSTLLSLTDQEEAIASGSFGVTAALNGETGKMVTFKRRSPISPDYMIEYVTETALMYIPVSAICSALIVGKQKRI